MYKKALLIISIFYTSLFISCSFDEKTYIEETLVGLWRIDSFNFFIEDRYYDVQNSYILNVISFEADGKISFPIPVDDSFERYCENCDSSNGIWSIRKIDSIEDTIPFHLEIISDNQMFNGDHKIIMYYSEDLEALILEILSTKLYLVLYKNLSENKISFKRMKKLEQMTKSRAMGNVPKEVVE